jgi:hypothetical protein
MHSHAERGNEKNNALALVPKLQLGNAVVKLQLHEPKTRSWSFASQVPKLELGNQRGFRV